MIPFKNLIRFPWFIIRIGVDLDALDSEHLVEDMDQLLLLRRHCLDGTYENFK